MHPGEFLGLLSLLILFGFAGEIIFRKYNIAPVIFYITLGLIMGPILHLFDTSLAIKIAPYLGAIVFAIILFEGGLEVHLSTFLKSMGKSFMFSLTVYFITAVLISLTWYFIFGDFMGGLLMGIIVGCTSAAIIVPIINKLDVNPETRALVMLESTITDMLTVILVFVVINMMLQKGGEEVNVIATLWNTLLNSIVFGIIAGFVFFRMYASIRNSQLSYMLVLALMFGMYSLVEILHGNGPLSVLILGLIVGNSADLFRFIKRRLHIDIYRYMKIDPDEAHLDEYVHKATAELSFISRVFFFILLGMSVELSFLTSLGKILLIFLIFAIILLARLIGVKIFSHIFTVIKGRDLDVVLFSMPRGLATAVVSFQPSIYGLPNADLYITVAFGIIVLTVLTMTIGLAFSSS